MGTVNPVLGVDGWRDGWVVAVATGRHVEWVAYPQPRSGVRDAFARLLDDHPGATVAVDIPIGVVDGPRRSDRAAQDFLRGYGTWQSIFLTPERAVVQAYEAGCSHAEAMAAQRSAGRAGTSIQAWNLIAKMLEVGRAVEARPGRRVVEAHPECSLRVLDPSIGTASKKTGRGVGLRLRALGSVFELPDLAYAPPGVPVDDLLDAAAVAWTAQRLVAGIATQLPSDPDVGESVITI